jgi:hypothetical protein
MRRGESVKRDDAAAIARRLMNDEYAGTPSTGISAYHPAASRIDQVLHLR